SFMPFAVAGASSWAAALRFDSARMYSAGASRLRLAVVVLPSFAVAPLVACRRRFADNAFHPPEAILASAQFQNFRDAPKPLKVLANASRRVPFTQMDFQSLARR